MREFINLRDNLSVWINLDYYSYVFMLHSIFVFNWNKYLIWSDFNGDKRKIVGPSMVKKIYICTL